MDQPSREGRLKADHEALLALDAASSILSLEATGEPPDRYTITFTGKVTGITRVPDGGRVTVEVTGTNQKGDVTAAGSGGCIVPSLALPADE